MTGRTAGDAEMLPRILQEAARLFVLHGYRGISMREIAEAVGISKAGLYYHFRDKEDLFIAVLRGSLEEIGRILDEASQATTARARVRRMMVAILDLPAERRALIRVASQEMVHVSPAIRADFNVVYQEKFVGRVAGLLATGMEQGELRRADPQLAAWLLLGMAYPFFDPTHHAAGVADLLVEVFFDGLGRA